MRRPAAMAAALAAALFIGACTSDAGDEADDDPTVTASTDEPASTAPSSPGSTGGEPTSPGAGRERRVRVAGSIATELEVPWGFAFLPDGRALFTQRDRGTISVLSRDGSVREVGEIEETAPTSEGGLLGLTVSPDFANDRRVFVYVTTASDNRVLSMTFDGTSISGVEPILTGIPAGHIHDGGQLRFGPDGYLYVSTGETGDGDLAQDRDSLGGKILRIAADGSIPSDNPDPSSPVWTLGHRNVQGLAFDERDRLWASEFGSQIWDELNLIRPDRNYGWPAAEGDSNVRGYVDPAVQWRTTDASPSSLAYADGSLWMASLQGERLWEVPIDGRGVAGKPRAYFVGDFGRLRAVVAAPDGSIWVTTSNRDGRGQPQQGDDRILRVTIT